MNLYFIYVALIAEVSEIYIAVINEDFSFVWKVKNDSETAQLVVSCELEMPFLHFGIFVLLFI